MTPSTTTLDDLVMYGSLTPAASRLLRVLMAAGQVNVLVSGPPWAGATTVSDALVSAVPESRWAVVIDFDCGEAGRRDRRQRALRAGTELPDRVEVAPSGGADRASLRDLVRLPRWPDMVCLELKDESDVWELALTANLGFGVISTVHAADSHMALHSLAFDAASEQPTMGVAELRAHFYRLFDIAIFCDIDIGGPHARRQITEIAVSRPDDPVGTLTPIFARDGVGQPMELRSEALGAHLIRKCNRVLETHQLTIVDILQGAEVDL